MKPSLFKLLPLALAAWSTSSIGSSDDVAVEAFAFRYPAITTRFGLLSPSTPTTSRHHLLSTVSVAAASVAADTSEGEVDISSDDSNEEGKKELSALIRKEGGPTAFRTKYGALNLFAIYYGLVAIFLGIPWYFALSFCHALYFLSGGRIDKKRYLVNFFTQIWGIALMRLTGCYPKFENMNILRRFYKEKRPAMFVANHQAWLDIPFVGCCIGWRNYKIVAKKELGKVPILGKSIRIGHHVMVDRTDRRSQLETLKRGISTLQSGVHLCTFPEGTRTKNGRLGEFKNGAFKMAHKAGAPVIPICIIGNEKINPPHWMFPYRPAGKIARVVVQEPIESTGKTEDELANEVRKSMIAGLPEHQRPENE